MNGPTPAPASSRLQFERHYVPRSISCPGIRRSARWPHRDRWTGMPKEMLAEFKESQHQQIIEHRQKQNSEISKSRKESDLLLSRDREQVEVANRQMKEKREQLKQLELENQKLAMEQRKTQKAIKASIYVKDAISPEFFEQFNYEQGSWASADGAA